MSNNNPHGHISSQPTQNPSWNPLQIPSYIPRQPQLAHMSNERPMVRSPLAWHAPAPPPDSIYNFMSANHKNLEHQMNPLLPPYVRGPSPFDSMDLSVQSSRSSNSPLNKSGTPHGVLPPHDYGHKQHSQQHPLQQQQQQQHHQQQQQTQMHAPNTYPIHLPTSSPSSTITHSHAVTHTHPLQQAQQRQQSQHPHAGGVLNPHGMPQSSTTGGGVVGSSPANSKYLSSNGNDCEMLPPPLGVGSGNTAAGSGNNASSGSVVSTDPNVNYMRDNEQHINESYSKMTNMNRNYDNELQSKSLQKPVELVSKDCNYTLLSNKMPHQVSPKKHSPIRNYRSHSQQQHQQQQQQQQHYNSSHAINHNGPHTPPTPQSPVGQLQTTAVSSASSSTATMQQMQTESHILQNSNLMDYNQLHLQHNNNYQQQQMSTHQQQQQQHQQPSPSSHHHHNQQQQQQHPQHQTHHLHFGSLIHQQLQPPAPQPIAPLQQIQQHQPHHQTSPTANTAHPHLTNLDAFAAQSNLKLKEFDMAKSMLHDISPVAATPTITHIRKQPMIGSLPIIRNESPDNATSNEDSVDSNSNSSRARRKRKPNKLGRTSSNESGMEEVNTTPLLPSVEQEKQQSKYVENISIKPEEQLIHDLDRTPERSPDQQEKSPKKIKTHLSPTSDESRRLMHAQLAEVEPSSNVATIAASVQHLQYPSPTLDEKDDDKHPTTLENGRSTATIPTAGNKTDNENDVETIDKIAEMIAQSSGGGSGNGCGGNDLNSNSNSSSKSNISSPKTKKQRQALKLRSAEQNSNSNCSTNSYSGSLPDGGGAANDNAVLAEELRKDSTVSSLDTPNMNTSNVQVTATKTSMPLSVTTTTPSSAAAVVASCPLSPQSNSRSCSSSSSSSSSCSNSSHSSCGSKENKLKNVMEMSTEVPAERQQVNDDKAIVRDIASANANEKSDMCKYEDEIKPKYLLKSSPPKELKDDILKSPTKSCFEEVENKLEEMFAGIEDELPASSQENLPTPANDSEVAHDLSLALELSTLVSTPAIQPPSIKSNDLEEQIPAAIIVSPVPPVVQTPLMKSDRPPQTKAAKKSTIPSPEQLRTSTPTPAIPTKVTPLKPRRLSVVIEPTNLKIHLEKEKAQKKNELMDDSIVIQISDDEKPSTSAAAAAVAAATLPTTSAKLRPAKENSSNEAKDSSTSTTKKNRGKTNARSGKIKSKGVGNGATGGGSGGKSTKGKMNTNNSSNSKKQQQKQKRKQQDSDDDNTPARESNGSQLVTDSKYKSPYILVKRDGTITVINAPTAEDVSEKQTKVKKSHQSYAHDRKNIRGMHSSTLSNKYDADTADKTWICVFCKRGPHRMGLGDLFGPYIITTNCEEYSSAVKAPGVLDIDAIFVNKRRRIDMVQQHPRNLPVVPATLGAAQLAAASNRTGGSNKKKKKSIDEPPQLFAADPLEISTAATDESENFLGMSKVSENSYEVWLHEDCAVWAPDVFLVGARVMGLDAAVWNSTRYNCVICAKTGAIVCCLQRGCNEAAHVPCARETKWSLNESNYKIYCQKHITTSHVEKVTTSLPVTTSAANSFAAPYS